jgi:hypothetical protein
MELSGIVRNRTIQSIERMSITGDMSEVAAVDPERTLLNQRGACAQRHGSAVPADGRKETMESSLFVAGRGIRGGVEEASASLTFSSFFVAVHEADIIMGIIPIDNVGYLLAEDIKRRARGAPW